MSEHVVVPRWVWGAIGGGAFLVLTAMGWLANSTLDRIEGNTQATNNLAVSLEKFNGSLGMSIQQNTARLDGQAREIANIISSLRAQDSQLQTLRDRK